MLLPLASILLSLLWISLAGCATPVTRWELHWQDEFEGDTLDLTKWSRCKRGTADWHNTMSTDPRLSRVRNGALLLLGFENPDTQTDPVPYLTGGVTSKETFAFQYGKVQIRARFKSAQGAWPALWMLGEREPWPDCGEIDLMEHLNFDDFVYQTVHSGYTLTGNQKNHPPHSTTAPIRRDKWNTYGCEWDTDRIVFTVNGRPTHTYPRVEAKGQTQWPFDQPFYFILSMQIGGDWVNGWGPTLPEHYPAGMEIDWVRVYKPAGPPVRIHP